MAADDRSLKAEADALYCGGRFEEAAALYKRAARRDASPSVCLLNRSAALLRLQKWTEAADDAGEFLLQIHAKQKAGTELSRLEETQRSKALWRRAAARVQLGLEQEALDDLHQMHLVFVTNSMELLPTVQLLRLVRRRMSAHAEETMRKRELKPGPMRVNLLAPAIVRLPAVRWEPVGRVVPVPVAAGLRHEEHLRLLLTDSGDLRTLLASLTDLLADEPPTAARPAPHLQVHFHDPEPAQLVRHALLLQLLWAARDSSQAVQQDAFLAFFCLWWSGHLPSPILPLLSAAARALLEVAAPPTAEPVPAAVQWGDADTAAEVQAMLRRLADDWDTVHPTQRSADVEQLMRAAERQLSGAMREALSSRTGDVPNITLVHPTTGQRADPNVAVPFPPVVGPDVADISNTAVRQQFYSPLMLQAMLPLFLYRENHLSVTLWSGPLLTLQSRMEPLGLAFERIHTGAQVDELGLLPLLMHVAPLLVRAMSAPEVHSPYMIVQSENPLQTSIARFLKNMTGCSQRHLETLLPVHIVQLAWRSPGAAGFDVVLRPVEARATADVETARAAAEGVWSRLGQPARTDSSDAGKAAAALPLPLRKLYSLPAVHSANLLELLEAVFCNAAQFFAASPKNSNELAKMLAQFANVDREGTARYYVMQLRILLSQRLQAYPLPARISLLQESLAWPAEELVLCQTTVVGELNLHQAVVLVWLRASEEGKPPVLPALHPEHLPAQGDALKWVLAQSPENVQLLDNFSVTPLPAQTQSPRWQLRVYMPRFELRTCLLGAVLLLDLHLGHFIGQQLVLESAPSKS